MEKCKLCPRQCNVDRKSKIGFCKAPENMIVSKIMLHHGEEPILLSNNDKGSGAIFFAGCNLRCVFCQNYQISHEIKGKEISPRELATMFKTLESKGAGNIDLVTPTHYALQIIEALKIYRPRIPIIWNSGGYESVETIKMLNGFVDIYLIDYKYKNNNLAIKYSHAPNYNENIINCLKEIHKQIPNNVFKEQKLVKGVVVRHLVLPGQTKDSFSVLDSIKNILGENSLVSIMSQYTPYGDAKLYPEINRTLSKLEYKAVMSHAIKLNFKNALVQELCSASTEMIPDFDGEIIEF